MRTILTLALILATVLAGGVPAAGGEPIPDPTGAPAAPAGGAGEEMQAVVTLDQVHLVDGTVLRGTIIFAGEEAVCLLEEATRTERLIPAAQVARLERGTEVDVVVFDDGRQVRGRVRGNEDGELDVDPVEQDEKKPLPEGEVDHVKSEEIPGISHVLQLEALGGEEVITGETEQAAPTILGRDPATDPAGANERRGPGAGDEPEETAEPEAPAGEEEEAPPRTRKGRDWT